MTVNLQEAGQPNSIELGCHELAAKFGSLYREGFLNEDELQLASYALAALITSQEKQDA